MWVVPSELLGDVGVGGGGGPVGYGHMGDWVCLGCLRVRYGGVGWRVEAMCGWGRGPCFALKCVEVVGVYSLDMGLTCFTSEVGGARC